MFQSFYWFLLGLDLTTKVIWTCLLPIRVLSWISNILVNGIFLAIIIFAVALFTGHIPDHVIQSNMDSIGKKAMHYIDPKGEKVSKITTVNTPTPNGLNVPDFQ